MKIKCKDCGREFDFTEKEQAFYTEKGYPAPIRCKECRDAKKNKNVQRIEENKNNDFEEMLRKFRENTIPIEQNTKRSKRKPFKNKKYIGE